MRLWPVSKEEKIGFMFDLNHYWNEDMNAAARMSVKTEHSD